MVTALISSFTVFIILLLVPWINSSLERELQRTGKVQTLKEDERLLAVMEKHFPGVKDLSQREMEVFSLIIKGITNKEIARHLGISDNTLKTHIKNIYRKVGVTHKRELLVTKLPKVKSH